MTKLISNTLDSNFFKLREPLIKDLEEIEEILGEKRNKVKAMLVFFSQLCTKWYDNENTQGKAVSVEELEQLPLKQFKTISEGLEFFRDELMF
jgi:Fe-S oxidoreductase